MQTTKVTLTPNLEKCELLIGLQIGARGRLLVAHIPSLRNKERTVISGNPINPMFRREVETALSTYVARPHFAYGILDLIARKG